MRPVGLRSVPVMTVQKQRMRTESKYIASPWGRPSFFCSLYPTYRPLLLLPHRGLKHIWWPGSTRFGKGQIIKNPY